MSFKVYKDDPLAVIPYRSDQGCAGYDLSSIESLIVAPHSQAMVDTGIILEFPNDCYARVAPRSGLATKNSIDVLAGVVDSSYKGRIKVILYNHGDKQFCINNGDRIAQLIFERIYTPNTLTEVSSFQELTTTTRGANGFGSSGV